jgi:hypothetical protein
LHFTPLIVLGVSALVVTVWRHTHSYGRALILGCILVVLLVNAIVGLTALDVAGLSARAALAMSHPPLTRGDQPEVARLVRFLRDVAPHREPIYVAASSAVIDTSLIATAERMLFGTRNARLRMLYAPQIDSRDALPLELLMQAQFVVVAEPFQYHLNPESQRVVQMVVDMFTQDGDFAHDFIRLPERFTLEESTAASVYRRVRGTPLGTALRTLRFMQDRLHGNPGGQPEWMVLAESPLSSVTTSGDGSYRVTFSSTHSPSAAAVYLGTLPDSALVTGAVTEQSCSGISFDVSGVDARGDVRSFEKLVHLRGDPPEFAIPLARRDATSLMLTVSSLSDASEPCPTVLERVRVQPRPRS